MKPSQQLSFISVDCTALFFMLSWTAILAAQARKNVLLLVADDIRCEIGAFGATHVHTPHLDELASRSLVLKANYVQVPVCGPTRASFMTSRRPDTLRTVAHTARTPTGEYWRIRAGNYTTLPQMFKEVGGYYTYSVGKTFDMRTSSFNTSAEWICDGPYSWSENTTWCGTVLWKDDAAMNPGRASHRLLSKANETKQSDVRIAAAGIARLNVSLDTLAREEAVNPDLLEAMKPTHAATLEHAPLPSPWFLALGFHRPHLPLLVPSRHLDLYPPGSVPLPDDAARFAPVGMPNASSECAGAFKRGTPTSGCLAGHSSMEMWQQYTYNGSKVSNDVGGWGGWRGTVGKTLRSDWAAEVKRYYYAAVSHTDEMIGAVLAAVRARGEEQNTIVAFIGDHGWHLDELGMWCKCTLFESATRAPIIIHVPGVTDEGYISGQLTEHVDLMPTLAAAAGLPIPERCPPEDDAHPTQPILCTEGMNVLPLIDGPALRRATFSQWSHPFTQRPSSMGYTMRTMEPLNLRYTEWLLMSYGNSTPTSAGLHKPNWNQRCAHELYIYANSSSGWVTGIETVNVADDPAYADLVATLRAQLHAGWRSAIGSGPFPPLPKLPKPTELKTCPMAVVPDPSPPIPPSESV